MTRYTPTLATCEDLATSAEKGAAYAAWDEFKEEVEDLFDKKFRSGFGGSCSPCKSLILVKLFADLLENGFEDPQAAETARSEYEYEIRDSIEMKELQERY